MVNAYVKGIFKLPQLGCKVSLLHPTQPREPARFYEYLLILYTLIYLRLEIFLCCSIAYTPTPVISPLFTCLVFPILEPSSAQLQFASRGHNSLISQSVQGCHDALCSDCLDPKDVQRAGINFRIADFEAIDLCTHNCMAFPNNTSLLEFTNLHTAALHSNGAVFIHVLTW